MGIFVLVCIFITVFIYYSNNSLVTTELFVAVEHLPQELETLKIVHLSDLHGKGFGNKQKNLVNIMLKASPDLIFITGDLIDSRTYDEEEAMQLIEQIVKIAPVYYVTGNHEIASGKFAGLEQRLRQAQVNVLRNERVCLKIGTSQINILGIDDYLSFDRKSEYAKELEKLTHSHSEGELTILLSHRPELLTLYSKYEIDLVFAGHAHGGQIRLPGVGGVFVPNQGLFPRYTQGIYQEGRTLMVLSRGLGNSSDAPVRVLNRPEVVVVSLQRK